LVSEEVIIDLTLGEPEFSTPMHVIDAAYKAMREGYTHYEPIEGLRELREAIAQYYSKYGVNYKFSNIIITAGSSAAMYTALATLLKAGDEAIVFEPYYPFYYRQIEHTGAKAVKVQLDMEKKFHLDIDRLRKAISDKTKVIIFATPNNPTGTVLTKKELTEIADVSKENNLFVISDEVYNEFVWSGHEHITIASMEGMEGRTIILNGVSKTFAMTGWRVGYAIASAEVVMRMARVPISSSSMVATFAQVAGMEALKGPWTQIKDLINDYQNRAQYFSKRLNEIKGITCLMPEASFYIFPSIKELGISSEKFTTGLLKYKVKVANGTQFGDSGEGHVRMSLCKSVEALDEAAKRIEKFVKSL